MEYHAGLMLQGQVPAILIMVMDNHFVAGIYARHLLGNENMANLPVRNVLVFIRNRFCNALQNVEGEMKREELETWLISKGYSKDKFGHYQKTSDKGTVTRFKMQSNSARYEKKAEIVDHNEWMKLAGGYYKSLSITPEGKLAGMKR